MKYPQPPVNNVVVDGLWEERWGPYSADDMRAYAAQCVRVALEEAVDHCRKVMDDLDDGGEHAAVERVHNRIRSMIN